MKKLSSLALVMLAVLSGVIGIIYFIKTSGNLPHFFLGYAKGSAHKHTKHGAAFVSLAVVLLIGAWMTSGQQEAETQSENSTKSADK